MKTRRKDAMEHKEYFFRNKKSKQTFDFSRTVKTMQGTFTIQEIIKDINKEQYWIPSEWPKGKPQRGECCGLYALETALNYGYQKTGVLAPPARKGAEYDGVSLRFVAKEKGLTAFGEIFSVKSLKILADYFQFPFCEIVKPSQSNKNKYTRTLCELLKKNRTLLVSCDTNDAGYFPNNSKGLNTHWVLIFGFFYIEDQCHFLVSQFGQHYVFPADKLFESNEQLPEKNPKRFPYFVYYKNKSGEEFFRPQKKHEKIPSKDLRYAVGESLDEFRFSLFCVPIVEPYPCIELPWDIGWRKVKND